MAFPQGQCNSPQLHPCHYLTKMGIQTVPRLPYSPDLAPCDILLFPKLRGCRYETIEEMKEAVTKVIDTLTEVVPEVVGTVQQVHCSWRRLLRRGLEFHVCTINKSAHTKKSLETYLIILVHINLFVSIGCGFLFSSENVCFMTVYISRQNSVRMPQDWLHE